MNKTKASAARILVYYLFHLQIVELETTVLVSTEPAQKLVSKYPHRRRIERIEVR
jgi:hypothetical protein